MLISEPESQAIEGDHEKVIQALKDWRAKEPSISKELARRSDHTRPSAIGRVFRTIAFGCVAVAIGLAATVWQSGSRELGQTISTFQAWLTRSLPVGGAPSATPTDATKRSAENTADLKGTPPLATEQRSEEELNAIKSQIDGMTNQLTEVRRIAEQLAANQQRMGEDIAALKADQESISKNC